MTNSRASLVPVTDFGGEITRQYVFNRKSVARGFVAQNSKGQPLFSKNANEYCAVTSANYAELVAEIGAVVKTVKNGLVESILIKSGKRYYISGTGRQVINVPAKGLWVEVERSFALPSRGFHGTLPSGASF